MTEVPDGLVRFRSRVTFRDLMEQVVDLFLRSAVSQAIGAWFLTMSALILLTGGPWDVWLPGAFFGLALLTGLPLAPLVWWSMSRRRDMLIEDVEADETGMTIRSVAGENRQLWAVYRTARETPRTFLLLTGGPVGQSFAKDEMSVADADAFRSLLRRIGIYRERTTFDRVRPLIGLVVGVLVAIGFTIYSSPPIP